MVYLEVFLECTHEHRLLENAQIGISGPVAWSNKTLFIFTQVEALLIRKLEREREREKKLEREI